MTYLRFIIKIYKIIKDIDLILMENKSEQFLEGKCQYIFNIDRGGTFTDFYVQEIRYNAVQQISQMINQYCFKVPSVSHEGEGPIVGIRKFLSERKGKIQAGSKISTEHIREVRLGTTIATNALLQRKGVNSVMILSSGFEDILQIREQTRPNIFDLTCTKPQTLTPRQSCLPINSRVYVSDVSEMIGQAQSDQCKKFYLKYATTEQLEKLVESITKKNPQAIGISLCNSYLTNKAEKTIQVFLREKGVKCPIQKGSNYIDLGYLKRTQTANLDAYLNPILSQYFTNISNQFQDENFKMTVMKSDGGFTNKKEANASKMLLSGPAGGLIGYCQMAGEFEQKFCFKINDLLGLDMGGTSTDVSKVKNREFQLNYSFSVQGLEICTPHLQIDTIAAGGGSKLGYKNGMLTVGPQSVGSNPGPVCYGIGDELALTDANLVLNRLDPCFFPKVFGKNKNQGPNRQLSLKAFEEIAKRLKKLPNHEKQKSIYELAEGYIEIANQLMAKSARKILTLGKPDALVIFGSAGGQHGCDIAEKIGVENIIIHKFSGILSAYGLSKTPQSFQTKTYLGLSLKRDDFDQAQIFQKIPKQILIDKNYDEIRDDLIIGYMGTSYTIKVPLTKNVFDEFERRHKEQNGFILPNKSFKVQEHVRTFIKYPQKIKRVEEIIEKQKQEDFRLEETDVFLDGNFKKINKYSLIGMRNCQIEGPALLLSQTSTILIKSNWNATVINENIHLYKKQASKNEIQNQAENQSIALDQELSTSEIDPIKLTIYSTRFMGIAEEMGKVLQKTSISTNIRERLDFSCGVFDWNGHLLANAPHLPVHLGSMETAVLQQISRGIVPGDVVLTNHPIAGGAHLPDLTVISCFQIVKGINFYVASRGHHADIGGITPGSMPPFSKTIFQEGVAIEKFLLMKEGLFLQKETRQLFKSSRRIDDNILDLLAQISANEIGIKLLKMFVKQNGFTEFSKYVKYIFLNAKQCVENLLCNFSLSHNFKQIQSVSSEERMDDGTYLKLTLTIDRNTKKSVFDFHGTGTQVVGNTNAPKAITRSAILYCLRCLIGEQIPLNSGCLIPIEIILPQNSIINPSRDSAVVGGNVETSQKLVDLIFRPFQVIAGSQGTMNNFLFGNQSCCYYETICGGSGAGQTFDGKTIQCHMTNTRITDIEHLQKFYPIVLTKFLKNQNTGGEGIYNGGDGVIREFLFLQDMEVSVLSERRIFPAFGLKGGKEGKVGRNFYIMKNGITKNMGHKNCLKVGRGDMIRIETPGGGGYGLKKMVETQAQMKIK